MTTWTPWTGTPTSDETDPEIDPACGVGLGVVPGDGLGPATGGGSPPEGPPPPPPHPVAKTNSARRLSLRSHTAVLLIAQGRRREGLSSRGDASHREARPAESDRCRLPDQRGTWLTTTHEALPERRRQAMSPRRYKNALDRQWSTVHHLIKVIACLTARRSTQEARSCGPWVPPCGRFGRSEASARR